MLFLSNIGSQFLSDQKVLSVTTKDTAELNVKHVTTTTTTMSELSPIYAR